MRKRKKWMGFITMILGCLFMAVSEPQYVGAKDSDFVNAIETGGIGTEIPDCMGKYKGKSKTIRIPERYKGIDGIDNKYVETVIIPSSITYVSYKAFRGCTNLKNVVFEKGSSITTDDITFWDSGKEKTCCPKLTSITLPSRLKCITSNAFRGCKQLEEIHIPETVVTIGYNAFEGSGLKEVRLPNTLKELGDEAFMNCNKLKCVTITGKNVVIGKNAFSGCKKLETLKLPDNLKSIGNKAFYDCDVLKKVRIPASVKDIGTDAFGNCDRLSDVTFEKGFKIVCLDGFDCIFGGTPWYKDLFDKESTVVIQGHLEKIGADCMDENGIVTIPSHVRYICSEIDTIGLKNADDYQDDDEYEYEDKKIKVVIPSTVKVIANKAFADVDFYDAEFEIADNVLLEGNPFWLTDFEEKNYKDGYFIVNHTLLATEGLKGSVNIPKGVKIINQSVCKRNDKITQLVLPSTTEVIKEEAFAECKKLKKVVLNNNLKSIGAEAFMFCDGLKTVVFGKKLENIGSEAFQFTHFSAKIVDLSNIKSIGENAFGGDPFDSYKITDDGKRIDVPRKNITLDKVIIGKKLKEAGYDAFDYCLVKEMTVPSNLKESVVRGLVNIYTDDGVGKYGVKTLVCKKNSPVYKNVMENNSSEDIARLKFKFKDNL